MRFFLELGRAGRWDELCASRAVPLEGVMPSIALPRPEAPLAAPLGL